MMRVLIFLLFTFSCWGGTIHIIAGKEVGTNLTKRDLRNIFLGKNSDVVIADNLPLQEKFQHDFLFMSQYKVNQVWAKLVFTGKRMAKDQLHGDNEVNHWIRRNPKGVSYVKSVDPGNRSLYKIQTK